MKVSLHFRGFYHSLRGNKKGRVFNVLYLMEHMKDWIQQKWQDELCKNAKINWTKGSSEMDTVLPWHLLNWMCKYGSALRIHLARLMIRIIFLSRLFFYYSDGFNDILFCFYMVFIQSILIHFASILLRLMLFSDLGCLFWRHCTPWGDPKPSFAALPYHRYIHSKGFAVYLKDAMTS